LLIACTVVIDEPCMLKEGFRRNVQRIGDRAQDVQRGPVEAALDLAQIGV
jgi:hypothetical protein